MEFLGKNNIAESANHVLLRTVNKKKMYTSITLLKHGRKLSKLLPVFGGSFVQSYCGPQWHRLASCHCSPATVTACESSQDHGEGPLLRSWRASSWPIRWAYNYDEAARKDAARVWWHTGWWVSGSVVISLTGSIQNTSAPPTQTLQQKWLCLIDCYDVEECVSTCIKYKHCHGFETKHGEKHSAACITRYIVVL